MIYRLVMTVGCKDDDGRAQRFAERMRDYISEEFEAQDVDRTPIQVFTSLTAHEPAATAKP